MINKPHRHIGFINKTGEDFEAWLCTKLTMLKTCFSITFLTADTRTMLLCGFIFSNTIKN